MQCIQIHWNISHKINGAEMKTKCIWACYITKRLRQDLFNEGAISSLTDIVSVFDFCPHTVKQAEGSCSHWSSYPPSKFLQSGNQKWVVHRSLMYCQKKKSRPVRSGEWVCLMNFFVLGSYVTKVGICNFKTSNTSTEFHALLYMAGLTAE